jgi:Zn-dependent protease
VQFTYENNSYLIFVIAGVMLAGRALDFLSVISIFLVSLTIHEYAHGWMAYRYGDDTAKRMGRLTLNPLAHISLIGTIILPLIVHFGWAKPVPVNFSVLTKRQIFMVAAVGPFSNILLALTLAGAFHIYGLKALTGLGNFVLLAILFNLILAIFNLLPIPPLDGSKMVSALLKSPQAINAYNKFAQYGMFILIGFLLLGGFQLIRPVIDLLYALLSLPAVPALTILDCPRLPDGQGQTRLGARLGGPLRQRPPSPCQRGRSRSRVASRRQATRLGEASRSRTARLPCQGSLEGKDHNGCSLSTLSALSAAGIYPF